MKLKLLLLFGLFYETLYLYALQTHENRERAIISYVPFGVDIWKIFYKKNETVCVAKNVQKSFDGAASVVKTFTGPTQQVGEILIPSFKILIDKLEMLSKSNSATISKGSTELLKAISLLNKFGQSPTYLLHEWAKAMPEYSQMMQDTVTNLSGSIGLLTQHINKDIANVSSDIIKILKQFESLEEKKDRSKNIDVNPLIKSTQILTNTIALIAETSLDICGLKSNVYEAIAIVSLLLDLNVVGCLGTYVTIAAVLYLESDQGISETLHNCLLALTQLVQSMANYIDSMANTAKMTSVFLKKIVELTKNFNDQLYSFGLGFCNEARIESVKITVDEIKRQLLLGD